MNDPANARKNIVVLLIIVVIIPLSILPAQEGGKPVRVILFGWDGAQREHVQESLGRGELPVLQGLIDEGVWVDIDAAGVTDTKAGWAEILTGYGPDVTGVFSNGKFQPIPEGFTLFERLKEHYGKDRFITAAVIGKDHHVGGTAAEVKRPLTQKELEFLKTRRNIGKDNDADLPGEKNRRSILRSLQRGRIIRVDGKRFLYSPAEPYFLTWKNTDVWEKGLGRNSVVGERALALLEKHRNESFFFFIHFADIDHEGHKSGENSKQYNDAIVSCDEWTGKILFRLKQWGLLDDTLIYITADHGFDEGARTHARAPKVFLVANDRSVKRAGTRADIAPTVYATLGIDQTGFQPPLSGRPLNR